MQNFGKLKVESETSTNGTEYSWIGVTPQGKKYSSKVLITEQNNVFITITEEGKSKARNIKGTLDNFRMLWMLHQMKKQRHTNTGFDFRC